MPSTQTRPGDLPGSRARRRRGRAGASAAVTLGVVAALALSGCGRSANQQETGGGDATASTAPSGSTSGTTAGTTAAAPGDFGSLKGVCGSSGPKGPSNQRGVTDSTITIGTAGDPGSSVTPGLGQEFFDVGDAFVAWCNAAGGINGRKLKLVKHDAKLTDAAARMIDACQTDFMLVGGGMVGDAAAVKPRLACNLAQIPAYSVSPEAMKAGLQVRPTPDNSQQYPIGGFRAMVGVFPDAAKHLAVAGSNFATIRPQGLRLREALQTAGFTVAAYQEWPVLVSNFRPFMEEMKGKSIEGYQPIGVQDLTAPLTAMNNVGFNPKFVIVANQLYDPSSIKAVKASGANNVWLQLDHMPFELADQSPVVKQAVDILHATKPKAKTTDFTALSFQAWLLWAKSARACGADLTSQCILAKAGAQKDWSAGGLYPTRDITATGGQMTDCVIMMKVTPNGFTYDKNATKPNSGFFNCDPKNTAKLATIFN